MSDHFPIDKRGYIRYLLGHDCFGVLEFPPAVFGAKRYFHLLDISKEGLSFESSQQLPLYLGEEIKQCRIEIYPLESIILDVTPKNRRPCLMLEGKVGFRYGCETKGMPAKAFMQIRQVIKSGYVNLRHPRRRLPPLPPESYKG